MREEGGLVEKMEKIAQKEGSLFLREQNPVQLAEQRKKKIFYQENYRKETKRSINGVRGDSSISIALLLIYC